MAPGSEKQTYDHALNLGPLMGMYKHYDHRSRDQNFGKVPLTPPMFRLPLFQDVTLIYLCYSVSKPEVTIVGSLYYGLS